MVSRKQATEEEERRRKMKEKQEKEEEERKEGHIVRWKSDVPVPPIPDTNYASFLLSLMAQHGGKKALMDASTGKHHTYSDICGMVPRVCAGLVAAGVGSGDVVLLLSPNHIDFPVAVLAVMVIPATCVPANPAFSPEELAHVVQYRYHLAQEGSSSEAHEVLSRSLLTIPLFHIYGYNVCITTLMMGGCVLVMGKFTPRLFLQTIERHKITYAPIVPHIANILVDTPLLKEYDISSILAFNSASAPLPPALQKALMEKTGRSLSQSYGLTETSAAVSKHSDVKFKMGSVGRVLPYMEVKIVAPGTSKGLRPGEEGEVWVRGDGVMLGYITAPREAATGLKEGGWFPTGDLGRCDEDGFLFLTDRIKDLIKVKGFQVSPSELEAVLRGAEGVGEVAVVGVPSPRLGEAPRAWVVPAPGGPAPTPQALQDYVAARVTPYKCLAGGVQVVKTLPKNTVGKVLKRRLRDDYLKTPGAAAAAGVSSKL